MNFENIFFSLADSGMMLYMTTCFHLIFVKTY